MNYSQKRTLIGRIVYIGLTLMAVTILVVTMYTFFGSSKRGEKDPPAPDTVTEAAPDRPSSTRPPQTDRPASVDTEEPTITPPDDEWKPTDVPPKKDWTKLKVLMPVQGNVYKHHDLTNAVYSVTMNDYRVHQGIDIECTEGDDVLSCAYGTVTAAGYDPFMGYTVVIDHGDGLISRYRNLSDRFADGIEEGATVYAGQVLGVVGDSAIIEISDEPHLHFELELDGEPLDPMTMIDYNEEEAVSASASDDK